MQIVCLVGGPFDGEQHAVKEPYGVGTIEIEGRIVHRYEFAGGTTYTYRGSEYHE